MKKRYLNIPLVVIGLVTVYFFPEPETNFISYIGTWILFIVIGIIINKK